MLTPPQQPLSPFAQINQSLPPLAPPQQEQKPPATMVFAPIHAPTHAPQLHMGATPQDTPPPMADLSGMAQRPSPLQTFAAPSSPNVFAKPSAPTPGSIEDEQQHVQGKLAKDYQKDIDPWGSPDNHPGVFGKIMHGLSKAGNIAGDIADPGLMRAIPSTDLGRQTEEKNLEKKEVGLTDEQAKNKLSGAQTDEAEATIPLRENQAEAAKLIEITPDMATALGNSSLAGQQVSQGVLQHLQATHENNSTKLTTTGQNNQTKLTTTGMQDDSREAVAGNKPEQPKSGTVNGKPAWAVLTKDGWIDPQTKSPVPNFAPAPTYAQVGNFQPTEGFDPGSGQLLPGTINSRTGDFKPNSANGASALPHDVTSELGKEMQTAREADKRLRIMETNAQDALRGDQQAMLSLVANHIGMTLGAQKGARINQAVWQEAIQSAPWLQNVRAQFDQNGYLQGVTLTPGQIHQMVGLAHVVRENQWKQAEQAFQNYGIPINGEGPAAPAGKISTPNKSPEIQNYQGHEYEKGADGQWHLRKAAK